MPDHKDQPSASISESKLIENLLPLLALGLVLLGCIAVLTPFLSVLLWSGMFVYATRKIFYRFNTLLGGHSMLSAVLFVSGSFILLVVPLILAGISFGADATKVYKRLMAALENGIPSLPEWLIQAPLLGERIHHWWTGLQNGDPIVTNQLQAILLWGAKQLLGFGGMVGGGLFLVIASSFLAIFIYAGLPTLSHWLRLAVQRISGSHAEDLLRVAGSTLEGVVLGILGTALAQGLLVGVALFAAGVPSASGLTFLAIILSLIPGGATLVWLPCALWLYHDGQTGWAIAMTLWALTVVGSADNVIKPLLIGKSGTLPFILVMLGLLGGAIQFGAMGIFLGPTLLAVAYALIKAWLNILDNKTITANEPE
jgi:predicted PurR-regulated permease PerM